jgi:hypothetical protein
MRRLAGYCVDENVDACPSCRGHQVFRAQLLIKFIVSGFTKWNSFMMRVKIKTLLVTQLIYHCTTIVSVLAIIITGDFLCTKYIWGLWKEEKRGDWG